MSTHRFETPMARLLLALAFLGLPCTAQTAVPAGALLPVTLEHGLNARKLRAGQPIHASLLQTIPGTRIQRGARLQGAVVAVQAGKDGPARLELRFDAIRTHGRTLPLRASLRALASALEVEEAQIPEEMSSRGLNPESWDTRQIGGDQVYRGGGPVEENGVPVGKPGPYGAVATPQARPGQACRGVVAGNSHPQALGLFSADACGLYGYPELRIQGAGRSGGPIVLTAPRGNLNLRGGSALLLRAN